MLITCWYLCCFPVSWALWFAISCCLVSHRSASSPLTFFMIPSLTLCLCFLFRSCPIPPQSAIFGISHAAHAGQYADVVLTLLHSLIKHDGSTHTHTHTYIYIHIYILTLGQNQTAVIKISCLAMLGNYREVKFLVFVQLQRKNHDTMVHSIPHDGKAPLSNQWRSFMQRLFLPKSLP